MYYGPRLRFESFLLLLKLCLYIVTFRPKGFVRFPFVLALFTRKPGNQHLTDRDNLRKMFSPPPPPPPPNSVKIL